MTLSTLLLMIGGIALVLTLITVFLFKAHKNIVMSYLQNFCGALFIFSGWVKAIDPLGTGYKMEQYFGEFESTFSETWFSFIAPIFPWLSEFSLSFSVFMIIFEIVLGVMLIVGAKNKFTAWAFMLLVAFFTFLTGFTYLTGYVPQDVNFFQFGQWGPYVESNMKVTDCGCFGDFIKLKPKTSFLKDVFLMIPALYFVFRSKDMHELFKPIVRTAITAASILALGIYCFSNFSWDLPHIDFRPFQVGVNIAERQKQEEEAVANAPVSYNMTNKKTGEMVSMPMADYIKKYKEFPKEEWDLEQLRGEPTVPTTKISDFAIESVDGGEVTEELISDPNYSFLIIAYKLYHDVDSKKMIVSDTTYTIDTLIVGDSTSLVKSIKSIDKKEIRKNNYTWDKGYQSRYTSVINPLAAAAEKAGMKVQAIAGQSSPEMIDDFRHATQTAFPFHTADDILLKTIVRSNPGVVLMKNGKIVNKWHYKKLPSFEEIKAQYMK